MSDELDSHERDDVAALLRAAGKRQGAPRERTERVRASAFEEWRCEVGRRSRRRIVLWTTAVAAAITGALLVATPRRPSPAAAAPSGPEAAIHVEMLDGAAFWRATGGELLALSVGQAIRTGSELRTAENGRAAIRLSSHSVRLDAATTIRLLDSRSLALDRGAVYLDSGGAAAGPLAVHTPLGVIEEIGTQFEARLVEGGVRVRLREGAVILHRPDRVEEVRAGTELTTSSDGLSTRREIEAYGPEWEWITGITPLPDLEGRSAREFLAWVARERGWGLAFADEAVARSAREIALGGRLGRLTPQQALDAVLPTCRMTYRVEAGILRVETASPAP